MPRTIRFDLDENCHHAIAEGLRRRGIDVTTTTDAGLLSSVDEEQVAHCLGTGRILVTQDRDLLRLSASGVPHAGIADCDKDTKSIGAIILGLVRIWEGLDPDDMVGRVQFL